MKKEMIQVVIVLAVSISGIFFFNTFEIVGGSAVLSTHSVSKATGFNLVVDGETWRMNAHKYALFVNAKQYPEQWFIIHSIENVFGYQVNFIEVLF